MSRPRVVIFPGLTSASEWMMMADATQDIAEASLAAGDTAEFRLQSERADIYRQEAEKVAALSILIENANLATLAGEA